MNNPAIDDAFKAMGETTWPAPEGLVAQALEGLPERRRPPLHPATVRRFRLLAIAGTLAGAALAARRISKSRS